MFPLIENRLQPFVKHAVIIDDTSTSFGGTAKVAYETAKVLAALGVNVIYFAGYGPADARLNGIRVVEVHKLPFLQWDSTLRGALSGLWDLSSYVALRQVLHELNPRETIVHIHSWTHALSSSVFSAIKREGFKPVVTLHDYFTVCPNGGLYDYVHSCLCQRRPCSLSCIMHNCDKRSYAQKLYRCIRIGIQKIAMSNVKVKYCYLSQFTLSLTGNLTQELHPSILPNPISDMAVGRNASDLVEVGQNSAYLYVGRFDKEKNPRLFCEALTRLGLPGTLCGNGPEWQSVKDDYPNLRFVGWCDAEQLQQCYRTHRALIMTSSWYEAQPLVCLEAMISSSMPSIVPNTCGAISYIEDGVNGLLYNRDDVDSLCEAIEKMQQADVYQCLVSGVRHCLPALSERHSVSAYADNLISVYEDVLA